MGMLRLLCFMAFLSYPQLNLQGFLHLPHHRFLFHTGLLSYGRSYPLRKYLLVGRFGEIFLTASRCCFPDFTGFAGFFTLLPLATPFTHRFFQNRACNRSARVRSTGCIPCSRCTRPAVSLVSRTQRVAAQPCRVCCAFFEPVTAVVRSDGSLLLRTVCRHYPSGRGRCSSNPLAASLSSRQVTAFHTPFVFSSYIFSMTNTDSTQ